MPEANELNENDYIAMIHHSHTHRELCKEKKGEVDATDVRRSE